MMHGTNVKKRKEKKNVWKFYSTVSVIHMSAVFNIHCVIKVKHFISPSFISKHASTFTALLPMS